MVNNYVVSKYISGTSLDDVGLDIHQMTEDDRYEISDVKTFICDDIYYSLDRFLDAKYTRAVIMSLLNMDGSYRLDACDTGNDSVIEYIILNIDNQTETYWYAVQGEFITRQIYVVNHLDQDDLAYLVTDHVISPEAGVDLVERCYHPYFTDIYEARQYRHEQMQKYENNRGAGNSGYRIFVMSRSQLDKSDWYHMNLKANEMIDKYELDIEDFRYEKDIKKLEQMILADSYEDLPLREQAALNMRIIEDLRRFVPFDRMCDIDEYLEDQTYEDIIDTADYVLTLALVNADTKEVFDAVHEALGPNEYRIGNLTDKIYMNNPDVGYIVVNKGALIRWYKSCYAINEWVGSEESPFHGVFQPNEQNTLLSFREFHPEKHPVKLPTDQDILYWENKYRDFKRKKRMIHNELKYDESGGVKKVYGEWFYEGIDSDSSYGIWFNRDYGSHSFTENEIINLLNGEEITVEHFITKMEIETTIKGMLQDCASVYDTSMNVCFVRTDIDWDSRHQFNIQMGIEEPEG